VDTWGTQTQHCDRRFRLPYFQTNQASKSFIPTSITLINKKLPAGQHFK